MGDMSKEDADELFSAIRRAAAMNRKPGDDVPENDAEANLAAVCAGSGGTEAFDALGDDERARVVSDVRNAVTNDLDELLEHAKELGVESYHVVALLRGLMWELDTYAEPFNEALHRKYPGAASEDDTDKG